MTRPLTFGVCAPSSYTDPEKLNAGLSFLRAQGHTVIVHPQTHARIGQTQAAGTVTEKIAALYDLLQDPEVEAIMCARGGNFALHLLPHLDYDLFRKHPKPLIGFSDATALLNAVHEKTGQVTYHGPMVTFMGDARLDPATYPQMIHVLTDAPPIDIPLPGSIIQQGGQARGRLLGGNLDVFRALIGTPHLPDTTGAILFFEDIGLELNHFDRTLCSLKLTGLFDRAAGLIFGQFTEMKDTGRPFGFTVAEIIAAHTSHLNIPVVTNAPFGHDGRLPTFPVGADMILDASSAPPYLKIISKCGEA